MVTVLHIMPEFALAGAETMCTSLVLGLKKQNYNVIVASLFDYHSSLTKRLEAEGVEVLYLKKKQGLDFSMIRKLSDIMKSNKVQIVHTHRYVMQYAIPAAMIAGVHIRIHTVHNIARGEFGESQRILANIFYRFCNVVPVAISPIVKSTVLDEYKLKPESVPMIYNGADISKCIIKTDYTTTNAIKVLHIGRLTDVKNQPLIIRAIKILSDKGYDLSLDLYGSGENENAYKELIKSLSLEDKVRIRGLIDDVFPVMHNADIFVLPSKYEGMPMTLIEAMGTGLPIIASRVGGIPDMIVSREEGILIEPNLDELVTSLEKLINNPGLRKNIGEQARIKSQLFSAETMANNYSKLYETQLEK